MGDRANVFVQEEKEGKGVYLYTHWAGTELPALVADTLAKRWRWTDSAYLARIVFSAMIRGSEADETGYGISMHLPDGGDRVIVLDVPMQQVRIENHDSSPPKTIYSDTFEGFVHNPVGWSGR